MMRRITMVTRLLLCVVVFLMLTGCSQIGDPTQTERQTSVDETLHGSIRISLDDISENRTSFVYEGPVRLHVRKGELTVTYLYMCAYSDDGSLIGEQRIGNLSNENLANDIRLEIDARPEYVIVDHPTFVRYPGFAYLLLKYDESVGWYSATAYNDVPLEPNREAMASGCPETLQVTS